MARTKTAWSRGSQQAASRGQQQAGCRLVVALLVGMAGVGCSPGEPRPGADARALPVAATASILPTVLTTPTTTTATTVPPLPELPRGGRRIFPRFRVVGYYGMPGLDALGAGPPEVVAQRLLRMAAAYATPWPSRAADV
jgi:hypothetical protein